MLKTIKNFKLLLFLLIAFFGATCSSPQKNNISQRNVWEAHKPPKSRSILWEKCYQNRCEFLDDFGPNQYIDPNKTPLANETCHGRQCDELMKFGPNRRFHRGTAGYLLGAKCTGGDCERYEEYGPNRTRPNALDPTAQKCKGKQCKKLKQYVNDNFLKNLYYIQQE